MDEEATAISAEGRVRSMKFCRQCKNRGNKRMCKYYTGMSNYAEKCKDFEEKKRTNADRIRSFSDEELAMNMMCPNENGLGEIECDKNDNCNCYECILSGYSQKWRNSMRVYISGPISNDPLYYEKFKKVAYEIVDMGYKVINPAELINVMPEDANHKEYMNICIRLLEMADTIVMLPGWEMSKGACIEYGYALASDKNIIEWEYIRGGKDEQIN